MNYNKKTVRDIDVKGKKVLCRCDFNVPQDKKTGAITDDKRIRDERLKPIYEKVHEKFDEIYPDEIEKIDDCLYKTQKFVVRRWLLDDGKRVDGRGINEIRPLNAEIDLLDRVHGSGMFTRGQTQVLTVTTLGPVSDSQILDGIDGEDAYRLAAEPKELYLVPDAGHVDLYDRTGLIPFGKLETFFRDALK